MGVTGQDMAMSLGWRDRSWSFLETASCTFGMLISTIPTTALSYEEGFRKGGLKIVHLYYDMWRITAPAEASHQRGRSLRTIKLAAWIVRRLLHATNSPKSKNDCGSPPRRTALVSVFWVAKIWLRYCCFEWDLSGKWEVHHWSGRRSFWKGMFEIDQRIDEVGSAIKSPLLSKFPEAPVGVNECIMTLRTDFSITKVHSTIILRSSQILHRFKEQQGGWTQRYRWWNL